MAPLIDTRAAISRGESAPRMFYTYVLWSAVDHNLYTGSTNDLQRRLEEHGNGAVEATSGRRPLELVYYEACRNEHDARMREKYLKSAWGKRYLKSRMKDFFIAAPRNAAKDML